MRVRINLDNLSEKDKGYICGFYVGDGNIFVYSKTWAYRVRFHTFIKEIAIRQRIREIFAHLCNNLREYESKNNTVIMELHSKDLVNSLIELVTKDGVKKKKVTKEFLKGYIEGLIDSDGYVQRNYAEITTMNENLKNDLISVLNKLKIKHNIRNFDSHLSKNIGYRVGFSLNNKLLHPVKWASGSGQTAE